MSTSQLLGELDLHLITEGRHERLWDVLGAHPTKHNGRLGVAFAVWAPNAKEVQVAGSFNDWDGARGRMTRLGGSGVWETFIPGVKVGATYKYKVQAPDGAWRDKADPMAQFSEVPPATASVVTKSKYRWGDSAWLNKRAAGGPHAEPVSIYELHLGSWRRGENGQPLGYRDVTEPLIEYVKNLGFTHVEFMPLAEHPFGGSWGYQVTGYYSPTSRFGTPDDLRYMIDRLHRAGIGVILDWVPGHFPKDNFALARFDGTPLYEHPDPRRGEHQEWGTYVFNYGRHEVRNFLVANALYWIDQFHIDGLRVDAVASMLYLDYARNDGEWEPNIHGGHENLEAVAFLQETNATVYKDHPGVMMIAEESTSYPGVTAPTDQNGLGFGFKWNMGWMNDSLRYISRDPIYRSHHEGEVTFSFVYAFSENYVLPISHDEVVHGKGTLISRMPGGHEQQLAGARGFLGYMWAHPGKNLLFMGQELGQYHEWNHDTEVDWGCLQDPRHVGLHDTVAALNRVYQHTPALWQRDHDATAFMRLGAPSWNPSVVAFARQDDEGRFLTSLTNFSGSGIDLDLELPAGGTWHEVLNTDATELGGSGAGNLGSVTTKSEHDTLARVHVPALATVWLRHKAV